MSELSRQQQVNTTRTQWYYHIEAWEQSGKPQAQFCRELNLSLAMFSYWRTQYLQEQRQSQRLTTNKTLSALAPCKNPTPTFVAIASTTTKLTPAVTAAVQAKRGNSSLALPLSMPVMDK